MHTHVQWHPCNMVYGLRIIIWRRTCLYAAQTYWPKARIYFYFAEIFDLFRYEMYEMNIPCQ